MRKQQRQHSWVRLFLWLHAVSVAIFYIFVWFRTAPPKDDRRANKRSSHATDTQASNTLLEDADAIRGDGVRGTVWPPGVSVPIAGVLSGGQVTRPAGARSKNFVSIIVPARDEERNIHRCVRSLLEQDYEHFEVIVVDDGSIDGTPVILDNLARFHPHGDRLWILRLRELPAGWAGKPHALHAGVQEAHGDWLLFTDADTWHAPDALRTSVKRASDEGIDLFTLGSKQELRGFWNKVMMPMAFLGISMQYPSKLVNDPLSPVAIANGQYILIRRAVYDALGGYARPDLRSTLLDDRDLAHAVKENGYRLRFVDGRNLVHVYMYRGLGETWRGWRKNAFLGSRGGLAFMLLQLIGLPMVSVVPFLLPLLVWMLVGASFAGKESWMASARHRQGITPAEANVLTLLELGPLLAYRTWLNREMDVPWYYSFTHSLAGAVFEGILAQSMWRVLTRKGVDWRGRKYYISQEHQAWSPYPYKSKGRTASRGHIGNGSSPR